MNMKQTHNAMKKTWMICACALLIMLGGTAHAQRFQVEGSDLGMGVGARGIAMGGAQSALADDVYAVYWNPAGMADMTDNQMAGAAQLNSKLDSFNFLAAALGEQAFNVGKFRVVPGFAYVRRLSFDIVGSFGPNDLETVFLEYVLPGIPSGFSGHVQSATDDYRMVFGVRPPGDSKWRFGFSVARLRCVTNFCGVESGDPANPMVANVLGKDTAFNIGVKYLKSEKTTLALTIRDVDTDLSIASTVLDNAGFTERHFVKEFPKDMTVGMVRRPRPGVSLAADFQMIFGNYGTSEMDFKMLRFGYEKDRGKTIRRYGVIVPVTIESSITKSIKDDMPSYFSVSAGMGWRKPWGQVDLAFYAHPMMSYQREEFYPGLDLSYVWKF